MRAHPVVRYTIDPDWAPLEYLDGDQPEGLMVRHLKALSAVLPMRFEYVRTTSWGDAIKKFAAGQVDLLSSSSVNDDERETLGNTQQIVPYYVGSTIVAAGIDHPMVFEIGNLAGLRVGVVNEDDAEAYLRDRVPSAQLSVFHTPWAMLDAVARGAVDVAIGPELVLLPLMGSSFRGQLGSAGTLVDLPVVQRMLVHGDATMLKSILNRALLRLTAGETDAIVSEWVSTLEYLRPSYAALLRYYRTEAALAVVLLLFLGSTVMFALHLRRRAQRDAERKMRFLAMVSHEIRNAMNAVVGPLDVLPQEPDAGKRNELIDTARNGASLLLETVSGLLDLSTLRARKARIDAHPTDVGKLIADVLRMLQPGCSAEVALWQDVALDRYVVVDGGKYRQVLMNLLTNAIKFTEQGHVNVVVRVLRAHGRTRVVTRVEDTGPGIAQQDVKAVFEAYAQTHDETVLLQPNIRSPKRGSGLGLTICRELVALLGGTLSVESEPGKGSVFWFELPVELADALPKQDKGAAYGLGQMVTESVFAVIEQADRLPVLAVDDNPVNVMLLRKQFDILGWPVVLCQSGRDAMTHWKTTHFGLVLLDCTMPDIDGYNVAAWIRDQERHLGRERSAIIAVSARDDAGHRQKCHDCGMDEILLKPVDVRQLRRVLVQWAQRDVGTDTDTDTDINQIADSGAAPHVERGEAQGSAASRASYASQATSHSPQVTSYSAQAMAQLFVRTNTEDLAIIRQMQADGRGDEIAQRAHRVAGAALVMQESVLADAATTLHDLAAGQPDDWSTMAEHIDRLDRTMTAYAQSNGIDVMTGEL